MKRARFFSAISLMLLSICILGAGVYAANTTDRYMGITGGSIQIPVNLLGVTVKGYIGTEISDSTLDFTSSYNNTDQDSRTWSLFNSDGTSKLEFDLSEAEEKDDVLPLILTLVITNESDVALEAYFYEATDQTEAPLAADYLGGDKTADNYIVGVTFESKDIAAYNTSTSTPGTCTIKITFALNQLLETGGSFGFGYVLRVQEKTA